LDNCQFIFLLVTYIEYLLHGDETLEFVLSNPVGILSNPMYCKAQGALVQIARCDGLRCPAAQRATRDRMRHALHRGFARVRLHGRGAYRHDGLMQMVECR
jgi:hypothetical protein